MEGAVAEVAHNHAVFAVLLDELATAKGKDIEPLRKRVLALEKLTDAEEYADALEKLNADILALMSGENEAVELEKILKREVSNV